ncbi:hypothetical protein GQ43DRAFT_382867, partial [Delitschia confertaspora ATCC 74209]
VCHALSDEDCVSMLNRLRDTMKPEYSTLLLNEIVLPDMTCSYWGAAFDVSMMAVVNGRERTKGEWEKLLGFVRGLRIKKIWTLEEKGESVIDIRRAE